jgi:hypothetical protein
MSDALFGPGTLFITRTDIANQPTLNVGYCQEFSYDESGETKELYGQLQFPLAIARGTVKATGKIKAAQVSGLALNALFHGMSLTAGSLLMAQSELMTIVTNAATAANGAHFDTDLGLTYAAGANAGLPLLRQPTGTAQATLTVGQYTVTTAGVYTFSTPDQTAQTTLGATPMIAANYAYTATTGQSKIVTNQPIGYTPTFQLDYATVFQGKTYYSRFFACVSNKLSHAHKLTDFMMPEIDFGFFANAAQQVYKVTYPTAS